MNTSEAKITMRKCGYEADRDRVASLNIAKRAFGAKGLLLIVLFAINVAVLYHVLGWLCAIHEYGQWTLREPNFWVLASEIAMLGFAFVANVVIFIMVIFGIGSLGGRR